MQATKLENDDVNKCLVLRKGLEHIADSVGLWNVARCMLNYSYHLQVARLETHGTHTCNSSQFESISEFSIS